MQPFECVAMPKPSKGLMADVGAALSQYAAVAVDRLRAGAARQVEAVNARIAAERQAEAEPTRAFGRIRAERAL